MNTNELERGYYAVMGGFEVVISTEFEENSGDILEIQRTLTPCGTVLLARLGLLPFKTHYSYVSLSEGYDEPPGIPGGFKSAPYPPLPRPSLRCRVRE